jgi:hypothetical protein
MLKGTHVVNNVLALEKVSTHVPGFLVSVNGPEDTIVTFGVVTCSDFLAGYQEVFPWDCKG